MIKTVVPMLTDRIKEDNNRATVIAAVESLVELLDKIGQPFMCEDGMLDDILARTRDIFAHKVSLLVFVNTIEKMILSTQFL